MLIINADDLGYSPHRDAGIFAAYQKGYISSASLMVNGANVIAASQHAKELQMPVGLHLNLTEGIPLTRATNLRDDEGCLLYKMNFWWLKKTPEVLTDILEETKAQVERFKELMGYYPTRVDGHQHAHIASHVPEVLAPYFQEIGVRHIRIPDQDPDELTWLDAETLRRYETRYVPAVAARLIYCSHGLKTTIHFMGLGLAGQYMTIHRITNAISKCYGTIEFMVHPGFLANTHISDDPFDTDPGRHREYLVLRALKNKYKLIQWSDIQ
jgi:predicted glycoside hydrolase/deacetylase ChbG (UPF0249 family)